MNLCTRFLIVLTCFSLLTACGGGGGTTSTGGGIGGTGLRIGEITELGSIVVDAIDFDIDNATILLNGEAADTDQLQPGMVAAVEGEIADSGATGVAITVVVDDVIKGEVESKIDANNMVVQGQIVQVDETTVYEAGISPASLDGISVGDFLEIYGFVRGDGVVLATRVEDEDSLSERRVTGFAASVGATTFTIGTQVIDFSGADTSDLPGGVPANGQLVRVRASAALGTLGELIATVVETEDLDDFDDNDDVEIEGFVTEVLSATQFMIGSQLVQTSVTTQIQGGVAADIVVGVFVEAEGELASGILFADEIEFESTVEIEANIDTITGNAFTLVGLPGIVVQVDGLTEYEDKAASFGDLANGDHLELRARFVSGTTVIATKVSEKDASVDVQLQGLVDAAPAPSDPTFSILGILVDTTGFDDSDFEGEDDTDIGRAAFFAAISAGTLVKVEGELSGTPVWEKVELEGEDD